MSMKKNASIASLDLPPPKPTGNVFTGWTVLANSIVGTGMLGLAYALSQCGWVLGLTMFAIFGILSLFALHLINAICMNMPNKRLNYFSASVASGVPGLKWFIDSILIIHNVGVDVAYLQVFGSMGTSVLQHWIPDLGNLFWVRAGLILGIVLLLSPVCFLRTISRTAPSSALGLVSFLYVVTSGVTYTLTKAEVVGTDSLSPNVDIWGILGIVPVFIFGFSCHFNAFPVAEDMKDRSQGKLDASSALASLSTTLFYIPAMCIPYAVYGDTVKDNFYMNMSLDDISVHIGFVLLPFAVLTAYPLLLLPCRVSMTNIAAKFVPEHQDSNWLHVTLTSIFLLLTSVLAVSFDSLGVTMSFIGIIGTNTITFIVPTYLYCKMFNGKDSTTFVKADGSVDTKLRRKTITWYASAALFVFSCALFPICLAGLIKTLV